MSDSRGSATPSELAPSTLPEAVVLGCRIHRVGMDRALEEARRFFTDGGCHQIVTADSSMVAMAGDDPELRSIINGADLVVPDSTGIVWAARRVGRPVPERVAGVDLMERLCELASRIGKTAYFLGAAPGIADEAARVLEARYPGFQVVGSHHGFLGAGDDSIVESEIAALKPDLLFVAMGIPRQEKWIRSRIRALGVSISIGVGGSFDCHSGRVSRAPAIFQRLNIEWLYRLVTNPTKYRKVALLPRFAWRVWRRGSSAD